MALSALGVVHGVRGAPRDPCAIAVAVGVAAWLAARGWGPEQESSFLHRQLASILRALQKAPLNARACLLYTSPSPRD
eukprot:8301567-Alexandrium_andersonii.AAC.1